MGNPKQAGLWLTPVVFVLFALALVLNSCSSSKNITKNDTDTTATQVKTTDPFAGLDEAEDSAPAVLPERLEAARGGADPDDRERLAPDRPVE